MQVQIKYMYTSISRQLVSAVKAPLSFTQLSFGVHMNTKQPKKEASHLRWHVLYTQHQKSCLANVDVVRLITSQTESRPTVCHNVSHLAGYPFPGKSVYKTSHSELMHAICRRRSCQEDQEDTYRDAEVSDRCFVVCGSMGVSFLLYAGTCAYTMGLRVHS